MQRSKLRFEYRHPRFPVDLSTQFTQADETLAGRCTDISTAGMKILLDRPLQPNSRCKVLLRYASHAIELNARVAYTGPVCSGVEFLCESPLEHHAIAQLVSNLANSCHRGSLVVMPRLQMAHGSAKKLC
jgi:hypothetical protein